MRRRPQFSEGWGIADIKAMSNENAIIQSISITLPDNLIQRETKELRNAFKAEALGRFFKYGNTVICQIFTDRFNPVVSMKQNINDYILFLYDNNYIAGIPRMGQIGLHEIQLRFDIDMPEAIFCRPGGFWESEPTEYRVFHSNDYRQMRRETFGGTESKGRQRSFITVEICRMSSRVFLFFSGKYLDKIPLDILDYTVYEMKDRLLTIGSIYLTQATNPEDFKISKGSELFLPNDFRTLLENANWLNRRYQRRNLTGRFLRGALL